MLRAYLLIVCNLEKSKYEIANCFEKLDRVVNVDILGSYDIVVEIIFETMDELKEKVEKNITDIDNSMSTLTLIRSDDV
jgi:DNA-binding Lrp family transcriptional regulator